MHSSVRFNSFSNSTYFSNYQPGESLFSLKVNYHLPHIGRLPLPTSRALVTFVSLGRPLQRRSKQWQKATALSWLLVAIVWLTKSDRPLPSRMWRNPLPSRSWSLPFLWVCVFCFFILASYIGILFVVPIVFSSIQLLVSAFWDNLSQS